MDEQTDRRRRLRAARALGGFTNTADLAAAIPRNANLGDRTLRKLESGESELRPPAMREIAAACGLPYEFFTVDFSRLPELDEQRPAPVQLDERLDDRLRALETQVAALVGVVLAPLAEAPPASADLPKAQPG